jgi:hypothetical protein
MVFTLASGEGLQAGSSDIWNTGNITTITYNTFPRIKGTCLVWQARGGLEGATSGSGDWEIFLCDIDNQVVAQVTDDDYDDISPQTDGDYVVWQKHDTSRTNQIFLYAIDGTDPPGGTMISNNDDKDNYSPRIAAGRVVWTSQLVAHSFEPGEIMLHNAKTRSGPDSISDNTLDCSSPRINSETVIWVQSNADGTTTLFVYDLTSENPEPEPAPEGFVWPDSPQTDGNLTVLTRHDGSDREVFVYSSCFGVYEQITTDNTAEDRSPVISGGNIAWLRGEGEVSEIFVASYNADLDGDGIPYSYDNCPCESGTGFDADDDGCIDTINGLDDLIQTLVAKGVVDEQMQTFLVSKIENARGFEDKDNICNAIKQLETLVNRVNAQREKKISPEGADQIIAYTKSVIASYVAQLSQGENC